MHGHYRYRNMKSSAQQRVSTTRQSSLSDILWHYDAPGNDELLGNPALPTAVAEHMAKLLAQLSTQDLSIRQEELNKAIDRAGVTLSVYSEGDFIDRSWPMDIVPRLIAAEEWRRIEAGLVQRSSAINHFIQDVYNDRNIVKDKIIPKHLIKSSESFANVCIGHSPSLNIWANISATDLVRDIDGTMRVLEDNLRTPTGASYLLENRRMMKQAGADFFDSMSVQPVHGYIDALLEALQALSPNDTATIAVLTPGVHSSDYFEHGYLARELGALLVEGQDLIVSSEDGFVYADTIEGPQRIDVIYRRVDDRFLDPEHFNPYSTLGVRGLMNSWLQGRVAMANAPGTGIADDKVIYSHIPEMISYYLNEKPILPNVDSYRCTDDHSLAYILDNMEDLVIKTANESEGYGIVLGHQLTREETRNLCKLMNDNPRNYIAQPLIQLSTCPTATPSGLQARHVDLRPYIIQGEDTYVTRGGLTRVASSHDSQVTDPSPEEGSKDTWVVEC